MLRLGCLFLWIANTGGVARSGTESSWTGLDLAGLQEPNDGIGRQSS